MIGYPLEELYQEVAYIALNFHWSRVDLLSLDHLERLRWVEEINRLVEEG